MAVTKGPGRPGHPNTRRIEGVSHPSCSLGVVSTKSVRVGKEDRVRRVLFGVWDGSRRCSEVDRGVGVDERVS